MVPFVQILFLTDALTALQRDRMKHPKSHWKSLTPLREYVASWGFLSRSQAVLLISCTVPQPLNSPAKQTVSRIGQNGWIWVIFFNANLKSLKRNSSISSPEEDLCGHVQQVLGLEQGWAFNRWGLPAPRISLHFPLFLFYCKKYSCPDEQRIPQSRMEMTPWGTGLCWWELLLPSGKRIGHKGSIFSLLYLFQVELHWTMSGLKKKSCGLVCLRCICQF